jgi:hypothetical protein
MNSTLDLAASYFSPVSPTCNSFNSNHLTRFRANPPYLSPLESSGCRKQGWVAGGGSTSKFHPWHVENSPNRLLCVLSGLKPAYRTGRDLRYTVSRNYQCFLSLTNQARNRSKIPQCFLSLTDRLPRKYLCFLSLTKRGGWGVAHLLCPDALNREGLASPILFQIGTGRCAFLDSPLFTRVA